MTALLIGIGAAAFTLGIYSLVEERERLNAMGVRESRVEMVLLGCGFIGLGVMLGVAGAW